jgi:hypothetical protein
MLCAVTPEPARTFLSTETTRSPAFATTSSSTSSPSRSRACIHSGLMPAAISGRLRSVPKEFSSTEIECPLKFVATMSSSSSSSTSVAASPAGLRPHAASFRV